MPFFVSALVDMLHKQRRIIKIKIMVKLFVVGYPLDIQEADLMDIFSIHGNIHSIHLLTDKFTQRHKGFGFIEMEE